MKGVFVGLTTLDSVYLVDRLPGADEKCVARDFAMNAGGPATNAAVTFAYLGGRPCLVSAIGASPAAALVHADLARYRVRHVELVPDLSGEPGVGTGGGQPGGQHGSGHRLSAGRASGIRSGLVPPAAGPVPRGVLPLPGHPGGGGHPGAALPPGVVDHDGAFGPGGAPGHGPATSRGAVVGRGGVMGRGGPAVRGGAVSRGALAGQVSTPLPGSAGGPAGGGAGGYGGVGSAGAAAGASHAALSGPSFALPMSAVMVTSVTGERAVASSHGMVPRCTANTAAAAAAADADVILVDGHQVDAAIGLLRTLRSGGPPVLFDGGSWKPGTEQILPFVDVVICSASFRPPGLDPGADILDLLLRYGPFFVAVTDGPGPIRWATKDRRGYVLPPVVTARDTLGAGDVFHGAFAWMMAHGAIATDELVSSLGEASRVAARSVQTFGPRSWMT